MENDQEFYGNATRLASTSFMKQNYKTTPGLAAMPGGIAINSIYVLKDCYVPFLVYNVQSIGNCLNRYNCCYGPSWAMGGCRLLTIPGGEITNIFNN